MDRVVEAKNAWRDANREGERQRLYEGYSTRTGNKVYQDAYDAARYYISRLEEKAAVSDNARVFHHEERDAISTDIYNIISEINPSIRLTPMQKAAVRNVLLKYIEDRFYVSGPSTTK